MAYNYEYPYTDTGRYNSDWLLNRYHELVEGLHNLNDWEAEHKKEYDELKQFIDDLSKGILPEKAQNSLMNWIKRNAPDIISELIKNVWFGITDNGYFVAYSPDSWADIIFSTTNLEKIDTGYDFGRLIISFEVDEDGI